MFKFLMPVVGVFLLFSVEDSTSQFRNCFNDGNHQAQNSFAFDFSGVDRMAMPLLRNLSVLYTASPNLLISPFSIWSALTLALMGANGNTKLELERVLGHTSSKLQTLRTKNMLDNVVTGSGLSNPNGPEMRLMDKAYVDHSLSLKECVSKFVSKIDVVNFADTVGTAKRVNDDVSEATAGEIRNIVQPNDLVLSKFVLINAIYFKGRWADQFDPLLTFNTTFFASDITGKVEEVSVPTMARIGYMNYGRSHEMNADVLELPYSESTISMFLILPINNTITIEDTLSNLTPSSFSNVRNAMGEKKVYLQLPKFDLKNQLEDDLKQSLINLGIEDMFNTTASDFTDFSDKEFVLDNIVHQARVRIDEEGTVAAAVTGLLGNKNRQERPNFFVNRPFIFLIYDKLTSVTLFSGIIKDPRA